MNIIQRLVDRITAIEDRTTTARIREEIERLRAQVMADTIRQAVATPYTGGDLAYPAGNGPFIDVDGWHIVCDDEGDDDCPKRVWFAVRGHERHELDLSPYSRPSHDVLRAHIALGFPSRTDFGLIGPIPNDTILAAYWRERALAAEKQIAEEQQ